VNKTELANLDVVGSGPIPPNPAELLGSELCGKFLAEARAAYDHVIIDSPPILLASDATVLATMVDGTILVYRAKENSRGVAQRARTLLEDVGAHVYGAVLNAAQVRRGGYFREQLRTFYEYQNEEDLDDATRSLPDEASRDQGKLDRSDLFDDDADDADDDEA
jgi:Mrp family chromosome partitioning ATPase